MTLPGFSDSTVRPAGIFSPIQLAPRQRHNPPAEWFRRTEVVKKEEHRPRRKAIIISRPYSEDSCDKLHCRFPRPYAISAITKATALPDLAVRFGTVHTGMASISIWGFPLLPSVLNRRWRVDGVAVRLDLAHAFLQPDAGDLLAVVARAGVADGVAFEDQVTRFSAHANAGGSPLQAIVFDEVVLDAIAMAGHADGLVAKADSVLLVAKDLVAADEIVGVLVPDADAEAAVGLERVVLENSVLDPPAEEQAVFAIGAGRAGADQRPLRTAPGMETERGVFFAHAFEHLHIVALLEADAVAVVTAHGAVREDRSGATIQKNPRAAAAVEMDVLLLVAVNGQRLDSDPFDVGAADHGEDRRGLRAVGHHAIGVERQAQGERVSVPSREAGNRGVKAAGILVPDGHAVAHRETVRILQRDLFLAVITIDVQRRGSGLRFAQHGLGALTAHRDLRAQVKRIAHQEFTGADFDRAAAEARDVIDRGLERPIVRAVNVGIAHAHGDARPRRHC